MDAIAAAMKPKARPQINLDELNEVEMPERSTCAICILTNNMNRHQGRGKTFFNS